MIEEGQIRKVDSSPFKDRKGNAIHSFQYKEFGTPQEFLDGIMAIM